MKNRDKKGGCMKSIIFIIFNIILGVAIGIVIKIGSAGIPLGTTLNDILFAVGNASSGLFIWIAICTMISLLSKSKKWAAINVFVFLASMITANYLYSYFVAEWFVLRIVIFWCIMLIPCTFLGYYIWNIKQNKKIWKIKLKNITLISGTIIMLWDMFMNNSIGLLPSAILTVVLYIGFVASLLLATKNVKK